MTKEQKLQLIKLLEIASKEINELGLVSYVGALRATANKLKKSVAEELT